MGMHDRDWYAERHGTGRVSSYGTVWKIAAGFAIGIIVASAVIFIADRWRIRLEAEEAMRMLQRVLGQSVEEVDHAKKGAAARPAVAKQARRDQERQRREAAAKLDPDSAEARRAAAEAAARKERAWAQYYRKPAICDNQAINDAQMVQCANDYIRAKRSFEEQYAAGKL